MNKYEKLLRTLILAMCPAMVFFACSDDKALEINALKINMDELTLIPGDQKRLLAYPYPAGASIDHKKIRWSSSDESMATVDNTGMVTALAGSGSAIITAGYKELTCSCTINFEASRPHDVVNALTVPMSDNIVYSCNIVLSQSESLMQGFDITPSGRIFYSQAGTGDYEKSTIISCAPAANREVDAQFMVCRYFGHGAVIAAEEAADGKTYIWLNSHGRDIGNNKFQSNWSISRVEYQPGKVLEHCAGRTFFLNPYYELHPSLDLDHRRLLVGGWLGQQIHFFVYDLDEVLALPSKTMKVTTNAEGADKEYTVQGYDLNDCNALGHFYVMNGGDKATDIFSYSHQGHEVYGDYVYLYEGNAVKLGTDKYDNTAYITVLDYNGTIKQPRTRVTALADNNAWKQMGFSPIGYGEPESMKVRDDGMYLGVGARNTSKADAIRTANILYYPTSR